MQGATIKTYFAKKMGIDPTKIVNVALTPCTAKKFEIRRDEMKAASKYFKKDHTHTSLIGARMNAQSIAKGLRAIHSKLADGLKK